MQDLLKSLLILSFLFLSLTSWAQRYKFADDPIAFRDQLDTLLENTTHERSIQLVEELDAGWTAMYPEDQERLIQVSKQMELRDFIMAHEFTELYGAIAYGLGYGRLTRDGVSNLLSVTESVLKKYDDKTTSRYFQRIFSYYRYGAIYWSGFNRVYLEGDNVNLEFIEESVGSDSDNNYGDSYSGFVEEGPLMRASGVDVILVSPFDSVFMNNTSGTYIINDDIFNGQGGEFDWANMYIVKKISTDPPEKKLGRKDEPEPNFNVATWLEYPQLTAGTAICSFNNYLVDAKNGWLNAEETNLTFQPLTGSNLQGSFEFKPKERDFEYVHRSVYNETTGESKRMITDSTVTGFYPVFQAYQDDIVLNQFGQYISYKGGLKIEGFKGVGSRRVYDSYTGEEIDGDVQLTGEKGGLPIFNILSKRVEFNLMDSLTTAKASRSSIFVGYVPDSIYHTYSDIMYKSGIEVLDLIRDIHSSYRYTPFIDNFHRFYIDADIVRYHIEDDSLDILMTTVTDSLHSVNFESFGYFNLERFTNLGGFYDFHPLILFSRYGDKLYPNQPNSFQIRFNIADIANFYGRSEVEMQSVAADLRRLGYIDYNPDNREIVLLERLRHNVKADEFYRTALSVNRKNGTREGFRDVYPIEMEFDNRLDEMIYYLYDFDDIYIKSFTHDVRGYGELKPYEDKKKIDDYTVYAHAFSDSTNNDLMPNASMNFEDYRLTVRGVPKFDISHAEDVHVIPQGMQEIQIWGGADIFLPEGEVKVGDIRVLGKNINLIYQDYQLISEEIDDILFTLRNDSTGEVLKDDAGFELEYGGEINYGNSGSMNINHAFNKSGLKHGKVYVKDEFTEPPTYYPDTDFDTGLEYSYSTFPKLDVWDGGEVNFQGGDKVTERRNQNLEDSFGSLGNMVDEEKVSQLHFDSTRIRFTMPEIHLDSMYLKDPEFPGVFTSSIFPPFDEKLRGLPDGSMGFIHEVPEGSYPLYPDLTIAETYAENLSTGDPVNNIPDDRGEFEKVKNQVYPNVSPVPDAVFYFDNNPLILDATGLHAAGEISYLSASVKSDTRFTFAPDYVLDTSGVDFEIKKDIINDVSFPDASGSYAQFLWYSTQDSLLLNNRNRLDLLSYEERASLYASRLFTVYENDDANLVTVNGTLNLRRDGLEALDGFIVRHDFELNVYDRPVSFTPTQIKGEAVDLKINSEETDPFSPDVDLFYLEFPAILQGNLVDVEFDLENKTMTASKNEEIWGTAFLSDQPFFEFPYAQYATAIDKAFWDAEKNIITMDSEDKALFQSILWNNNYGEPEKDVKFKGNHAYYDLNTKILNIQGVDSVLTADARVLPDSNQVFIRKEAEMQTLHNAKLVVSDLNEYHNLIKGEIDILNRENFEGQAIYEYTNTDGDIFEIEMSAFQELTLEEINSLEAELKAQIAAEEQALDTEEGKGKPKKDKKKKEDEEEEFVITSIDKHTYATGIVQEEDSVYLTSGILYRGEVLMFANEKNLALRGDIKMDLKSTTTFDTWIPIVQLAGEALLEFPERKQLADGTIISSGILFNGDGGEIYTNFISPVNDPKDPAMFLASGELKVDADTKIYTIAPLGKNTGTQITGNTLNFDDKAGELFVEGRLNPLPAQFDQYLKMAGDGEALFTKEAYKFNTMMQLNLNMPSKAAEEMTVKAMQGREPKNITLTKGDQMTYRLAEIVGEEATNNYFEKLSKTPQLPIADLSSDIANSIILDEVELHWDSEYYNFFSKGKFKLLQLFGQTLDEEVEGLVEIRESIGTTGFSVYFVLGDDWYFFDMTGTVLTIFSNNDSFNLEIAGKETKKPKEGEFSLKLGDVTTKENLLYQFEDIYSQVKTLDDLKNDKKEEK